MRLRLLAAGVRSYLSRRGMPFWGGLIIVAVVFTTYFPALGIGFWTDDYLALDAAGRLSGVAYLAKFFDPRLQRFWYRPMVGIQWKVEYLLFRDNALGYHLVQVALHTAGCLLLYVLATRITRQWRIGFVAGLIYATLSLASMTVYWTAVHDPLAGVWGLMAILLWIDHLESDSRLEAFLTFVAFVGSLLSKEVNVILLPLLFLADRLLVNRPAGWKLLAKRYFGFVSVLTVYAMMQFIVVTRSVFTQQIGYRLGMDMFTVFFQDLALLTLPWYLEIEWVRYAFLSAMIVILLYLSFKRDRRLLFLGAAAILPVIVVAPIPPHLFNPRYLYLPLMASAAGASLLIESALRRAPPIGQIGLRSALALVLIIVVVSGSLDIKDQVENFGGFIRGVRLQFRPIYQSYRSFPPDSFLYFIDTPLQTQDISGLMFLRYGKNVSVGGVDRNQVEELRNHNVAYVCYLDEQKLFQVQAVDRNTLTQTSPALPVHFGESISLDRVDIASTKVKPGNALVLIFYWRATAKIDNDYIIFVHLSDARGQVVASLDSQPRRGMLPTSSWRINYLIPDGLALPIDSGIAPGHYTIELGLYELASMQRLDLINKDGLPVGDKIIIGPVQIGE